jgi:hypothetical protein
MAHFDGWDVLCVEAAGVEVVIDSGCSLLALLLLWEEDEARC